MKSSYLYMHDLLCVLFKTGFKDSCFVVSISSLLISPEHYLHACSMGKFGTYLFMCNHFKIGS